jgi:hypothetical protein
MGKACSIHGRNAYEILIGKPEGRVYAEDLGVDVKIILELILGKWVRRCGLDSSGLG